MSQSNLYEVTRAPLVEVNSPIAKRPVFVTIALAILWILLAFTAVASIAQVMKLESLGDSRTVAYLGYLTGMALVPAFLLVSIARARNWARISLLLLYALNILFRIFLFVRDGQFNVSLVAWFIVPAIFQVIAFALLFVPRSGRWFKVRLAQLGSTAR